MCGGFRPGGELLDEDMVRNERLLVLLDRFCKREWCDLWKVKLRNPIDMRIRVEPWQESRSRPAFPPTTDALTESCQQVSSSNY